MSNINKRPLQIALHGMDDRATKMLAMYFQGLCNGAAVLVPNREDADVDMFDADVLSSKKILETYLKEHLIRPVIALSVQEITQKGVFYIKKPVSVDEMLRVIAEAKKLISKASRQSQILHKNEANPKQDELENMRQDMLEFDIDQAKLFSSDDFTDDDIAIENQAEFQDVADNVIELANYTKASNQQVAMPESVEALLRQQKTSKEKQKTKKNSEVKGKSSEPALQASAQSEAQDAKPTIVDVENIEKDWFDEWFETEVTRPDE